MIEFKNVSKYFGEKQVLHNINTQFEEGKVNLIIGRSGSGKTVMMKCLVGLFTPEEGEVLYNDRNFHRLSDADQRKLRAEMGMVFQGSALFDSMTIEENVRFPLDMLTSMGDKEKNERVNFCLERVELPKVNKLYPGELSGGMKKRAAIARAIACNPRYLFCDEPNSGLDPKTALTIDELLTDITHEFGITTIINTHDLNSVIVIGETISFIYEGHLAWRGSSQNVLTSDNEKLNDFIFAQPLTQRIRQQL
ncbi:MAG: ATP-binding cassette domain-containing protein [Bacteroidales bacterium]|mgnify:FL=1|jgi:phospholipid/cholesterol/gamma-HCH transport system ATP-binding protein|nr:ATP-binding cassette domain-containing protein [Bacteroidales bacterium]MBQ3851451.1 ATP-binding cassette domain-containing protein [Bacteroidales bacterium]MBR6132117.1 ATP-binding cassette domain-containing protein [Bacteroidales bacterium]MCR5551145.1 ATP-binding cassette domain-containing protein [Bacteroidales bacterium]